MNTVAELVEQNVVLQQLRTGLVLRVNAVAVAGARRSVEAVVVNDVAVRHLVRTFGPEAEAVARVVVNHEIDEAAARAG